MNTERMTPEMADGIQAWAIGNGFVVHWVVTTGTSDFGSLYVARPWFIGKATGIAPPQTSKAALVAETLEEIRELIPYGLVRLERSPKDDPVIVEVWI